MQITICGVKYTEADVPYECAHEALMVQDACNLSGVLISLAERVKQLCDHKNNTGTEWKNHHPVCVMFLAQIMHLCTGELIDMTTWIAANDLCKYVIDHPELANAKA